MANTVTGSSTTKSLDGCDSRAPFDTGWHSGVYVMPSQNANGNAQQREICQIPMSNYDADYQMPSWPPRPPGVLEDKFDDLPIRTTQHYPHVSASQNNGDTCPLTDLLGDTMPYVTPPDFRQMEPILNTYSASKSEPSLAFTPDNRYNAAAVNNHWNGAHGAMPFLPAATNMVSQAPSNVPTQPFQSPSIPDTSASAIRAAGFCQPEYPSELTQLPNVVSRPQYMPHEYVQALGSRQHHVSGGSIVTPAQYCGPPYPYGGHSKQMIPPVPNSDAPNAVAGSSSFQSLPSLHNSSFQTDHYTQTQFRTPSTNPQFYGSGFLPQTAAVESSHMLPRPIRERFLSAPGGAFVNNRCRLEQISFGSVSSGFNTTTDFNTERSRSPFSRSSSAGAPSSWCPSPLQPQHMTGPNGFNLGDDGQMPPAHLLQFAELNSSNAYFWQYNTQSKQRGQRVQSVTDPYTFDEDFRDPIFASDSADNDDAPSNSQSRSNWSADGEGQQLRHPGKARRGDGTDTTPNPTLLYCIGNLLSQLNNEINNMHYQTKDLPEEIGKIKHASGSSESSLLPSNRREKNMLASRVCRLKRKAQHEANKIIMAGLKHESETVLRSIAAVEDMLRDRILGGNNAIGLSTLAAFRQSTAAQPTVRVAGRTSEFVSDVLQRVSTGDPTGGLHTAVAVDDDSDTEQFAALMNDSMNALPSSSKSSAFSRKRHNSSHPRLGGPSSAKTQAAECSMDLKYFAV